MSARTFYCHSCQCEKSVTIKVRIGRNAVRCRDCADNGKSGRGRVGVNSLYSREFNRWLDQDARSFIPYERPTIDQSIRDAYTATKAGDVWE